MRQWMGWCLAWACLLVTQVPHAAQPLAVDPLAVPALMSKLAASSQLVGIAHAGKRLVAVGWRGHILYSDDQGDTWKQASVPVSVDLTAVTFSSALQGWAVGHGGVILHSADAGQTWTLQQDGMTTGALMTRYYQQRLDQATEDDKPRYQALLEQTALNYGTGPEQPWLDVWFENDQRGYVVGTFNLIMTTEDGGANWIPLLDRMENPDGLHLGAIAQVGNHLYIASERGTVFRQEGERFVPVQTGYNGSFFGVVGNAQVVLAYGLRGSAYRSLDQGRSWEQVDTGVSVALTGAAALKDGRIALVSQGGDVLVGSALADRFIAVPVPHNTPLAGIEPLNGDKVALIGSSGVQVAPLPVAGSPAPLSE